MRGRIFSLVVSLVLSFSLWLSLAGQDASIVDLAVPLQIHSLPEHLLIKGDIPKVVTLRLRANTVQLRFLADRKMDLPLDLSLTQVGHNALPVLLAPLNLPRGVEVSGVTPEVVEFDALILSSKRLPVKPVVVGQPDPAYRLESLTLDPPEMTVQGPPEILDYIWHLETAPLAVDGLTQDALFAVNVVPPLEEGVTIVGSKEIQATVKISEIHTQAVFKDIPVEIEARKGEPASFIAQPARVSVRVSWPSSRAHPVEAREVRAKVSLDGEQLKTEGRITVPVVVVPPQGATVTAINPVTVTVSHVPPEPINQEALP